MSEQINSTLRYLSENDGGGVLPVTDDVMEINTQVHRKTAWVLCFTGQWRTSQTQFSNR